MEEGIYLIGRPGIYLLSFILEEGIYLIGRLPGTEGRLQAVLATMDLRTFSQDIKLGFSRREIYNREEKKNRRREPCMKGRINHIMRCQISRGLYEETHILGKVA